MSLRKPYINVHQARFTPYSLRMSSACLVACSAGSDGETALSTNAPTPVARVIAPKALSRSNAAAVRTLVQQVDD